MQEVYYIALTDVTGFQISQRTSKETTSTFEIGLKKNIEKKAQVELVYFYTRYDDLIDFIQFVDTAHVHGFEANGSYSPWKFLTLSGHYNFLHAINDSNGQSLANRPTHQFYSSAQFKIAKPLTILVETQFVGQRKIPTVLSTNAFGDIGLNYFDNASNPLGQYLPKYALVNLAANYKQNTKSKIVKELVYSLRVNNLFNKSYQDSAGFPHSRFSFLAGIEAKY